jgi:hypothetical protein
VRGQTKVIVLIAIVLALMFVAIGRNSIMKWAVRTVAKNFMGIELEMDSARLGIMNTDVKLSNVVVMSPKGFEDKQMMKASSIYVNYELMPLIFKKIHLTDLKLDISEIVVIKNPEGKMNTDAIKKIAKRGVAQEGGKGKPGGPPPAGQGKMNGVPLEIDCVTISLGEVIFKDYSSGGRPQVSTVQLGLSKAQFRNVSWDDVLKGMRFLASISNSSHKELFKGLGSILGSRDVIKGLLNKIE